MKKKRKNAGEGYGFMFSGAFAKKADAVKKEKSRKGSFVKFAMTGQGPRYLVMTPRTNPRKRKAKPVANAPATNPSELLVMGANPSPTNPHEITLPAGSVLTIRMNPVAPRENVTLRTPFSGGMSFFGPGLLGKENSRRGKLQRRVRKMTRRGTSGASSLVADVTAALQAQGYKASTARGMAKRARGSDFDSRFRDALRSNPLCGATITGGYKCSRKPGHKGPHLPQGATLRPKSRIPHSWREKNPSAEALRESFTGAEIDRVSIYREPHMPAGDYAQLGRLLAVYVKPLSGGQVQTISFAGDSRPLVLADESARQIYFAGGDQDVSSALDAFSARERGGLFELGEARRIDYKQRKEHVDQPEHDEWKHNFGEESGERPTVWFDQQNKRLLLRGGDYRIRTEGIIN